MKEFLEILFAALVYLAGTQTAQTPTTIRAEAAVPLPRARPALPDDGYVYRGRLRLPPQNAAEAVRFVG